MDISTEWIKAYVDSQRRLELWTIARENLQAAQHAVQYQWYNVSASRSYYATYTAMWIAVDDPPRTRWQHAGIAKVFAQGQLLALARDLTNITGLKVGQADSRTQLSIDALSQKKGAAQLNTFAI